ncbi:uncharacterized protein MELLADRAFT_124216 [Melampsora larici-populina 98AG31]|uniref:Secreted protein n=1 Tax=Melampsora larici-populina (strain 98AG31 / pathotype 3-4-7) TaxID=747676 RepID=F4RB68_MELLP|nr:uncharacterized protein MELLADRAFT_124216 [Melampsora larici-populina 98AG31]EGG10406.1 secreted protein [Melampsora larici-populina 98AG31]
MKSLLSRKLIGFALMLSMGSVKTQDSFLTLIAGTYTCDHGYTIATVDGLTGCRVGNPQASTGEDYYGCRPDSCTTENSKADKSQSSFANHFFMVDCALILPDGSLDPTGQRIGSAAEPLFPYDTRLMPPKEQGKPSDTWLLKQIILTAGQPGQISTRKMEYVCPVLGDNAKNGIVTCTMCGFRGVSSFN